MLDKNITKFFVFVISALFVCLIFSGCHSVSSRGAGKKNTSGQISDRFEKPRIAGRIENAEITESSGLAASRCQENVLWTHNDSGHENEIFALDAAGKHLGKWRVSGAKNVDWEDIALFRDAGGECFLYIGDFGNNSRKRGEMTIYRVKEPKVSAADKTVKFSTTELAEAIRFVYPEFRHDAETLLVHPESGDIYVLSKRLSGASAVYKLQKDFDLTKTNTLEKIADFSVPAVPNGFLTGGDISPDGRRVALCDYFYAYEITLPDAAKNFDEIWAQKPAVVELGEREIGEAVAYSADGDSLFATDEKKHAPLIHVKRK